MTALIPTWMILRGVSHSLSSVIAVIDTTHSSADPNQFPVSGNIDAKWVDANEFISSPTRDQNRTNRSVDSLEQR